MQPEIECVPPPRLSAEEELDDEGLGHECDDREGEENDAIVAPVIRDTRGRRSTPTTTEERDAARVERADPRHQRGATAHATAGEAALEPLFDELAGRPRHPPADDEERHDERRVEGRREIGDGNRSRLEEPDAYADRREQR